MDADKTLYPTLTAYCETRRRIDGLVVERSEIDDKINDESRDAAQLAATIIRSMRALGVAVLKGDRNQQVVVLMDDRLEIHHALWADAVPLVAEDVFDRLPEIDPEPSLEEAIAETQTHRTVWGDVVIGDGGFMFKILTGWAPPTDAELDAAAANGAIDDVFHADEEVE
jgi:hypothetical protein